MSSVEYVTNKTCYRCGETKTLRHFYEYEHMTGGHANMCKACSNKESRESGDRIRARYRSWRSRTKTYRSLFDTQSHGWPMIRHDTSNSQVEDPWDLILGEVRVNSGNAEEYTVEKCMDKHTQLFHLRLIAQRLKGDFMETPELLKGLELYESNSRLLTRWDANYPRWVKTYPRLDVMAQIVRSHSWQMDNPAKQKKDHAKFIGSWLMRANDRLPPPAPEHTISTEEEINILITEYKIANPEMTDDEARVFAERAVNRGGV